MYSSRQVEKEVLVTSHIQKRIINDAFILLHPREQLVLNIDGSPIGVFLAQCPCSIYQIIDPILGVRIFVTGLSLKTLHILGNAQAGCSDLALDIQGNLVSNTRFTWLKGSS